MATISPERRAMLDREKLKNASGGGNYFSTKNLTQAIIRLTPILADEQVGTKVVRYFINNRFHVCNEATHGKPGVIARAYRALNKLDDDKAKEIAASIDDNRKQRYITKIIVRGSEADGVKFFEMPRGIYEVIYDAFDKDGDDLSHALEGRDIRISKSGSGLTTEYSARIKDPSPLMPSKEERISVKAQAANMSIAQEIAANEQAALEALEAVIPPQLWVQIKGQVCQGLNLSSGSVDAEEAPAKAKSGKPAPVDDPEDTPAPAKAAAKPAPASDEDETPAPKAAAKPAPASDDDDDAPAKPAPKAAAAPAADDADDADEDAPVRPAAKPAAAAAKPAAAKPGRYQTPATDDE